jgi:hypothetical protein
MSELTLRQKKFVEAYIKTNDSVSACVAAGYSAKSRNSLAVQANRMLKIPSIALEIANFKSKKREELSKESFVDKAMNCFDQLEVTEANKPRFLQLAGQACDIIGTGTEAKTVNNTIAITNIDIKAVANDPSALLEIVRKMIAGQG